MSEPKGPVANALRAAGYKRVPSWWVTQEQLDRIAEIALPSAAEVNWIRAKVNRELAEARSPQLTREEEIERAWQARNTQGDDV